MRLREATKRNIEESANFSRDNSFKLAIADSPRNASEFQLKIHRKQSKKSQIERPAPQEIVITPTTDSAGSSLSISPTKFSSFKIKQFEEEAFTPKDQISSPVNIDLTRSPFLTPKIRTDAASLRKGNSSWNTDSPLIKEIKEEDSPSRTRETASQYKSIQESSFKLPTGSISSVVEANKVFRSPIATSQNNTSNTGMKMTEKTPEEVQLASTRGGKRFVVPKKKKSLTNTTKSQVSAELKIEELDEQTNRLNKY